MDRIKCVCAVVATCSDGVSDITGILAEWQLRSWRTAVE